MAYSNVPTLVWGNTTAASDLTGKLYYAGTIDTNTEIDVFTTAGGACDGVITLDAPEGRAAKIAYAGVEKVALGGTVVAGADLAVDATGAFVTATSDDVAVGKCLIGGAAGEIGSMLIYPKAQFVVA